jgi:hypothetical protein
MGSFSGIADLSDYAACAGADFAHHALVGRVALPRASASLA